MSVDEQLKGAMAEIKAQYMEVYNCDPSQLRGYHFDGAPVEVPPLGHEDNPLLCTIPAGKHIISHSQRATPGVRGWLTDREDIYRDCLTQLEENDFVINPTDPHVLSQPPERNMKEGVVLVQKQEDFEKRMQEAAEKKFQKFLDKKNGLPAEQEQAPKENTKPLRKRQTTPQPQEQPPPQEQEQPRPQGRPQCGMVDCKRLAAAGTALCKNHLEEIRETTPA